MTMVWLIWGGAAVSLGGLSGLVWCILRVWRARRAGLPDDDLRALVQRTIPANLAALLASTLGLMAVIVGIFLG